MKQIYYLALGLVQGLALMNLPPALDQLMSQYGFDYFSFSVLITAIFWSHAVLLIPGGILADRIGVVFTLGLGMIVLAAANFLAAITHVYWAVLLLRVLAGMGTGASFAAAMKLVALESPPGKAGIQQAFLGGYAALGSILAYAVIPSLSLINWRWAYLLPALASTAMIVPTFLRPAPDGASHRAPELALFRLAADGRMWILGFLHALSWGSIITLGNWAPAMVAEATRTAETAPFAWAGAVVMGIGGLGRIIGGPTLSRISSPLVAVSSMFLLAGLYGLMFTIASPKVLLILLCIVVLTVSMNFAAIFQIAYESTDAVHLGTFLGMINFIANLGAIGLTLICGFFKDWLASFSPGFLAMAIIAFMAGMTGLIFFYLSSKGQSPKDRSPV